MHAPGKGISDSALPYKRTPPSWLKIQSADVEEQGAFWPPPLRRPAGAGSRRGAARAPTRGSLVRLARPAAAARASLPARIQQPPRCPLAVCKLAKKGLTPSQIGVILRDSNGIAQVRSVTGNKILRLLKKNGACRVARPTSCGAPGCWACSAATAPSGAAAPATQLLLPAFL